MEKKKYQKLSVTASIISVLLLVTLIPALLHIKLADSVRSAWAGVNIFSVATGFLSVRSHRGERSSENV